MAQQGCAWALVVPLLICPCLALQIGQGQLRATAERTMWVTEEDLMRSTANKVIALNEMSTHSGLPEQKDKKKCNPGREGIMVYYGYPQFDMSETCDKFEKKYNLNAPSMKDKVWETLHMTYDAESRALCIYGFGYESRAQSTVNMIKTAVRALNDGCNMHLLKPFSHKTLHIGDMSDCSHDMAYAAEVWRKGCKTKLVPDNTMWAWPEAGLLPDYGHLVAKLTEIGKKPAPEKVCGWAGNLGTNEARGRFNKTYNELFFEVVTPTPGNERRTGITMKEQIHRWSCVVDLPAKGYSGRVPYLLHSGRPLLMVDRVNEKGMPDHHPAERRTYPPRDPVWYSDLLKPWVHYIPVREDLKDLDDQAEFAIGMTKGSNATEIGKAAQEFAQKYLSPEAAIKYLSDRLVEASQAPDVVPLDSTTLPPSLPHDTAVDNREGVGGFAARSVH